MENRTHQRRWLHRVWPSSFCKIDSGSFLSTRFVYQTLWSMIIACQDHHLTGRIKYYVVIIQHSTYAETWVLMPNRQTATNIRKTTTCDFWRKRYFSVIIAHVWSVTIYHIHHKLRRWITELLKAPKMDRYFVSISPGTFLCQHSSLLRMCFNRQCEPWNFLSYTQSLGVFRCNFMCVFQSKMKAQM